MTPHTEIEVVEPGLLTSVQDPRGRWGSQRFGVATGGALDPYAARVANHVVGNAPDAALLEITWDGPVLRFSDAATIAVAGADFETDVAGRPVARLRASDVRPGESVSFGTLVSGARAYLAVDGGIDVPLVLGSRSTDLRGGFGGFEGRALRAGDRLRIGTSRRESSVGVTATAATASFDGPIRILPGPHLDSFDPDVLDALCAEPWRCSPQADRMGCRLDGAPLARGGAGEIPSLGLPSGAIQLPADGRPIVLLADHQPTGGYAVPAVVIGADLRLLAQRLPGDEVRFVLTSQDAAIQALAELDRELSR